MADERDSISSLPDEILQDILSLTPTKFAISTSILSKRWRHVWHDTPSLSFDHSYRYEADLINKNIARYTARKMMTFQLCTNMIDNIPYIDQWIKFAMSRNVENLTLDFDFSSYNMPDFFYNNSSVRQLSIELHHLSSMIPICSVSWTSLKTLSFHSCKLSDESFARILSGCPVLQSLTLYLCHELNVLDLSKSYRLRTLKIDSNVKTLGPTQIVAPYVHYLRLTNFILPCTLVDVSSLTEAKLDIGFCSPAKICRSTYPIKAMLVKLQNVEKLTIGPNILKIISFFKFPGVCFPSIKVKDMTFETSMSQLETAGAVVVLRNSTELRKLTVHTMDYVSMSIPLRNEVFMKEVTSKHVAMFMENMLKYTKTLEKMVVRLPSYMDGRNFEELLQMVPMISYKRNVSIALHSSTRPNDM